MQHVKDVVPTSEQKLQNYLAGCVLRVDMMAWMVNNMCVQSQLEDHGGRLTALESKHSTPNDITAVQAELAMIKTYLFGAGSAPDMPRDKSGLKAV